MLAACAYRARPAAMRSDKIFKEFSGNRSVTVKGSLTLVTPSFRIQTMLFPNVTGGADEA
ncbi:MAG: hypothetical protein ACI9P3_002070 [Bradyrhizobium sp.]|jgi:hypothetical protein